MLQLLYQFLMTKQSCAELLW